MSHAAGIHTADLPLCIDLDAALLRSDSLDEALFVYLRRNMWAVFLIPFWVLRGKAWIWHEVTGTQVDVKFLPYRGEVLQFAREQAKRRPVYLISGAPNTIAESIAAHLGCFTGVVGRSELSGTFGPGQFDYVGNSSADLAALPYARSAYLVGKRKRFGSGRRGTCELSSLESESTSLPSLLMHAIRVPQWVKNLLVFAALLLSHHFGDPHSIWMACLAFAAFCCAASSVYVINDLFDLEADRRHPTKRNRPIARGDLSMRQALLAVTILLLGAIGLSLLTNIATTAMIAGYLCLAVAYSRFLKRIVLLDAFLLAMFYIIRIFTGGLAVSVPVSFWTLLFSMFIFLSLAFVKRFAELSNVQNAGRTAAIGRGYSTADITQLNMLGTAAAVAAVVAMALYLNSPDVAVYYRRPALLWALCPLTYYWLARLWLLAARGQIDEDPIRFASHDRTSLIIGAVAAVIFLLAI